MENNPQRKRKKRWMIPVVIIAACITGFFIYTSVYYHALPEAYEALADDETVDVEETDFGWFFDGPSDRELLVFYPGAKVEAAAYAPFMHMLAEKGMDACLVKMPFNLALFGKDKAAGILEAYDHEHCWIGGHSLGGVMAASFAADHSGLLDGVILCASYPDKALPDSLTEITVYGSEDKVLGEGKIEEAAKYASPENYVFEIEGGNHANFGNYGDQKGDGTAWKTPAEQQSEAADLILTGTKEHPDRQI